MLYVCTVGRDLPIAHSLNPLASTELASTKGNLCNRGGGRRGVGNPVLGVIHAFKAPGGDIPPSLIDCDLAYLAPGAD